MNVLRAPRYQRCPEGRGGAASHHRDGQSLGGPHPQQLRAPCASTSLLLLSGPTAGGPLSWGPPASVHLLRPPEVPLAGVRPLTLGAELGRGVGEEPVPHTHRPRVRGLCDMRPLRLEVTPRKPRQQDPSPLSGRKLVPVESDHESFSQDFRPVAP